QAGSSGGPGPLTITTQSLPSGTVSVNYSATLAATGGQPPYNWSVSSGSLPSGTNLNSAGALSGTPTTAGNYTFTIRVNDSGTGTQSQNFTIVIGGASSTAFSISNTSFPNGTVGQPYTQTLTTRNGCGFIVNNTRFSVIGGSLPPGLTIQGNSITGTPTAAGAFDFTLQAIQQDCGTATARF